MLLQALFSHYPVICHCDSIQATYLAGSRYLTWLSFRPAVKGRLASIRRPPALPPWRIKRCGPVRFNLPEQPFRAILYA